MDKVKNQTKRDLLKKEVESKNMAVAKAMKDERLTKLHFGDVTLAYVGNPNRPEIIKWIDGTVGSALKELEMLQNKVTLIFAFRSSRNHRGMTGDAATLAVPLEWNGQPAIVVSMDADTYINGDDRVEALVHEMHHVKQMLDGRLKIDEEGQTVWEGQKYEDGKSEAQENIMALARMLHLPSTISDRLGPPWEVEAYTGGRALAKKIIEEKPWLK